MNDTSTTRFRWLLRCALGSCAPFAMATLVAACGGSSTTEGTNAGAQSDGGDATGGGSGGASGAGQAGGGAVAGSGAGGGTAGGGSSAGGNGASAGQGGSGASAGQGGSGGRGGDGGNAGGGLGGAPPVCRARPPQPCAGGPITLAKSCVPEALAIAGTTLPLDTCRALCEATFQTFSCSVSALDQTTITVQCATGCPNTP